MQCYLQTVGILKEDNTVDKDRAASMLWPNSLDAIDDCMNEQDGLFDKGSYHIIISLAGSSEFIMHVQNIASMHCRCEWTLRERLLLDQMRDDQRTLGLAGR